MMNRAKSEQESMCEECNIKELTKQIDLIAEAIRKV